MKTFYRLEDWKQAVADVGATVNDECGSYAAYKPDTSEKIGFFTFGYSGEGTVMSGRLFDSEASLQETLQSERAKSAKSYEECLAKFDVFMEQNADRILKFGEKASGRMTRQSMATHNVHAWHRFASALNLTMVLKHAGIWEAYKDNELRGMFVCDVAVATSETDEEFWETAGKGGMLID